MNVIEAIYVQRHEGALREGLRVVAQEGKNVRSGTLTAPSNRLSVQLPNQMWTFDFNFGQAIDYRT